MPLFVNNVPVIRPTPDLEIDSTEVGVGVQVFQLEVLDEAGNRSTAAKWKLEIAPPLRPVAVLTPPDRVVVGKPFRLLADQSMAATGHRLLLYLWQVAIGTAQPVARTTELPVLDLQPLTGPVQFTVTLVVRDEQGVISKPATATLRAILG